MARAVRLVVLVVPILNSMACGLVAAHLLPTPTSRLWLLPWWTGVLLAAVAGLVVSDRVARKLLPLAEKHKVSLNIENIFFNGYLMTPGEMIASMYSSVARIHGDRMCALGGPATIR